MSDRYTDYNTSATPETTYPGRRLRSLVDLMIEDLEDRREFALDSQYVDYHDEDFGSD